MKIGIIGSGNMGRAVGRRLSQVGHEVFFGARDPNQAMRAAEGYGSLSGPNDAAATFGEVLIWTIREGDPSKVLEATATLSGKIVIDLNNRDFAVEAKSGAWFEQAIAERLQAAVPAARVVKAFNTLPMEVFDTAPEALRAAGAQTFLAGADNDAKHVVAMLAADLGIEAIDLGDAAAAFRAAEALGDVIRLLIIDGGRGGRAHLKLIQLPPPSLAVVGDREVSDYR